MADELSESYNGPPASAPTPPLAPVIEEVELEEEAENIDELAEQLAVHQIISEERHQEILEEVAQCRDGLRELRERNQIPTESPAYQAMLTQMTLLLERLDRMAAASPPQSPERPPSNRTPLPSNPQESNQSVSVVAPEAPMPTRKRRQVL
jgi:hypothetical protein